MPIVSYPANYENRPPYGIWRGWDITNYANGWNAAQFTQTISARGISRTNNRFFVPIPGWYQLTVNGSTYSSDRFIVSLSVDGGTDYGSGYNWLFGAWPNRGQDFQYNGSRIVYCATSVDLYTYISNRDTNTGQGIQASLHYLGAN